jgi:predicted Zn-dependent protease
MRPRFSWKELLSLLGGLVVLAAVSWGVVAWLSPGPAATSAEGWEPAVKTLIRGQLETALNAPEIHKPKTAAALRIIEHRLEAALDAPLPSPLEIVVVASPEINAFTFPGGLIVVNEALLENAAAPEEVAAVLAHEMGHVFHRDPANSLRRSLLFASLATLTGDSGAVREIIQTLTQNALTRSVEDRADEFAFALLARARLRPSRLADFLNSLPDTPRGKFIQKNLAYLMDHPSKEQRVQKARLAPFSGPEEPLPIDWSEVKEELAARP